MWTERLLLAIILASVVGILLTYYFVSNDGFFLILAVLAFICGIGMFLV